MNPCSLPRPTDAIEAYRTNASACTPSGRWDSAFDMLRGRLMPRQRFSNTGLLLSYNGPYLCMLAPVVMTLPSARLLVPQHCVEQSCQDVDYSSKNAVWSEPLPQRESAPQWCPGRQDGIAPVVHKQLEGATTLCDGTANVHPLFSHATACDRQH